MGEVQSLLPPSFPLRGFGIRKLVVDLLVVHLEEVAGKSGLAGCPAMLVQVQLRLQIGSWAFVHSGTRGLRWPRSRAAGRQSSSVDLPL